MRAIDQIEASKKHFLCETNKNPLDYEVGEEMIFSLELYGDSERAGCPLIYWYIAGDDGKINEGVDKTGTGQITLKSTCDRPGAVRVMVKACGTDGKPIDGVDIFEGGAIAGFEDLELAPENPDDFDEFWGKQLAKLYEIEPKLISSKEVESDNENFAVFDVRISMGDADPVSGYVSIPKNCEPKSLKAYACYMGYGVASATKPYKEGYISFAINSHSIENGREDEYYTNLRKDVLADYGFSAEENANPESVYFKKMLLRDIQGIRYLLSHEAWNGSNIEIQGGSQGAFQATAMAYFLKDKVDKLTISVPWIVDLGGVNIGRMKGWRPEYTSAMAYYDTANFARRVVCPTYIDAGLGDYICPPSGIVSMYNAMSCPKRLVFAQNRTHSYYPTVAKLFVKKQGIE